MVLSGLLIFKNLSHAPHIQNPSSPGPWVSGHDDSARYAHGSALVNLVINLVSIVDITEDKLLYLDNSVLTWRGTGHLSVVLAEEPTVHRGALNIHVLIVAQHKVLKRSYSKLLMNCPMP